MLQRFRTALLLGAATAILAFIPGHSAVAGPSGKAIASKSDCFGCHATGAKEPKKMGPNYADVANKYAGDKSANAMLTGVIIKGGSGHWGSMAMPPHPQLSEADAKTITTWILSLKTGKSTKPTSGKPMSGKPAAKPST